MGGGPEDLQGQARHARAFQNYSEGGSQGKNIPGRENSTCKGAEV